MFIKVLAAILEIQGGKVKIWKNIITFYKFDGYSDNVTVTQYFLVLLFFFNGIQVSFNAL